MAKKTVASFASSCLLVAILCGVSYFLVNDHCELNINDIKTAQTCMFIIEIYFKLVKFFTVCKSTFIKISNKIHSIKFPFRIFTWNSK